MKFTLRTLAVSLKRDTVTIPFRDVSYFHGQMGAGKTSIARLIDYCLGGDLDPSPALQSELVGAILVVELKHAQLSIERAIDSDQVITRWTDDTGDYQLAIPARTPAGVILPGTDVENLSDLVFHLSGIVPPKVRTSKVREDSERRRLSLRDLLWYCYLDQDEIDSTFFHLDKTSDFKQYKSRDVLRLILAFHDEKIAGIEAELENLRGERKALVATVAGFRQVLREVGVESEGDLLLRVETLRSQADTIAVELEQMRGAGAQEVNLPVHAVDRLRERARFLGEEVDRVNASVRELQELQERERRHLHEIETLTLKFRRSSSAKEILQGVAFTTCPRCTQPLPERASAHCAVCGQPDEGTAAVDGPDAELLERDAKARIEELNDVLQRRDRGVRELERQRELLLADKARTERELAESTRAYDSVYLSRAVAAERNRAALLQHADSLEGLLRLPRIVAKQQEQIEHLAARETSLRAELREARSVAERDTSNLDRLKTLFLDCLLRTSLPGITAQDKVDINTKDFLPQVWGPEAIAATVTSFSNMSSGGKKTLFKCCFAVAVHRLAVSVGATLPELLIVDSPMKNISERENWQQFEGFHQMLYELKRDELEETQLVLIDKEFFPPSDESGLSMYERHMQPNEPDVPNPHPPLIPYYYGH